MKSIRAENFPTIKTSRLLLRRFSEEDIENVFRGLSHPAVIKYYGVSYSSLQSTAAQMDFFAELEASGTGCWWAVCNADNNVFYGACGLNNLDAIHQKAEIGFWLLPDFWGKGIITEAVELVCAIGFNQFGLHRIEAIIESNNVNSKKVMGKMNFNYEGTMKECEIKNGQYISLDWYAKLNPSS